MLLWKTGLMAHPNKTDFSADSYEDVYRGHEGALELIKKRDPSGFHDLMSGIYKEISYINNSLVFKLTVW